MAATTPAETPADTSDRLGSRLQRAAIDFLAAKRMYGVGYSRLFLHLVRLARWHGFRPREAHRDGLSNPGLTREHLLGTIPKRRLLRLQVRVNAPELEGLTEDKAVFYAFCRGVGLPIPTLYAVVDGASGWRADGTPLLDAAAWEACLEELSGGIFVKPARGVYGRGVRAYERTPGGFKNDPSGAIETPSSLVASLQSDPWQRLVVQRRLRNHPDIVRLTGSEVLQTVRLRSLVTGQGQCVVGGCFFKVVVSGQLVDNIAGGRTGNFCASVNREDGALRPALALSSSGIGTEPMPHHPRTGHAIAGFRLPWWEEAKALVRRAATLFSPHRTIGWDVGLTPEGPALIEGNSWWDPVNLLASSPADLGYSREMADLLARLRAEATR